MFIPSRVWHSLRCALLCTALLLTSACGSDEPPRDDPADAGQPDAGPPDAGAPDSGTPDAGPPRDTQRPAVLLRSPLPGSTDVSVTASIEATFSEPMAATSVTSSSVRVFINGLEVAPTSMRLSEDGRTLSLTLTPQQLPAEVRVELESGLRDLAGNSLEQPPTEWTWTYPAVRSYGPGQFALDGGYNVGPPSLALDGTSPLVAWSEGRTDSSTGNLYVRRWEANAWVPLGPSVIPEGAGYSAYLPDLELDVLRRPVVAYAENSSGTTDISVSRWNGSAWEPLGTGLGCYSGSGTSSGTPSMAIGASNTVWVVWSETDGARPIPNERLCTKRYNGSTWTVSSPGSTFGQSWAEQPHITMSAQGNPVVAWVQASGSVRAHIEVSRFNGSSWALVGGGFYALDGSLPSTPVVALDASDAPWVAWTEEQRLFVVRWNGTAWAFVGGNSLDSRVADTHPPALRFDKQGRAVVAWVSNASPQGARVRRWNGTVWEPLEGLGEAASRLEGGSVFSVSLALDSSDEPVLALGEQKVPLFPGDPVAPPRAWVDVRRRNTP